MSREWCPKWWQLLMAKLDKEMLRSLGLFIFKRRLRMILSQWTPSSMYDSEVNCHFVPTIQVPFLKFMTEVLKGNSSFFCVYFCNISMQFKNTGNFFSPFRLTGNKTITVKVVNMAATFSLHWVQGKLLSPVLSRQIFTKIAYYSNWFCKSRKDNLRKKLKSRLHALIFVDKSMKSEIFGYLAVKQQDLLRTLSYVVSFK